MPQLSTVLGASATLLGAKLVCSSITQRCKLRTVVPAKGFAEEQDEAGAQSVVLDGKDGLQCYARRWDPAGPGSPKAVLLMLHGMTVHSGIFQSAAPRLNSRRFACISFDFYAHGLSGSRGGVPGLQIPFQDWVDQVTQVLQAAQKWYPDTPLFLYAESFGTTVALAWCSQQPALLAQLSGIMLAAAPVKLAPGMVPPAPVVAVLKTLALLYPLLPLPDKQITDPQHWASAFGDKEWADRVWNDPLTIKALYLGSVPGNFANVLQLLPRAQRVSGVPVLVMHGKSDTRTLWEGSVELYDSIGSSDKQLMLYEGAAHQLLQNMPEEVDRVTGDMVEWMLKRC